MAQFKIGDTVRRLNADGYEVGVQPFTVMVVNNDGWVTDTHSRLHNPDNLVANPIGSSKAEDVVNHPSHYKSNGFEVIDVIEAFDLGPHLANSTKYILRAGKKSVDTEIQDLEKAQWYLARRISNLKAKRATQSH